MAGWTPILYRHRGRLGWTTLEGLYERFGKDPEGLEVLAYDTEGKEVRWTKVLGLYRHPFHGELLTSAQKWGVVETTPNHSLYDREGRVFYPEEGREMLGLRHLPTPLVPPPRMVDVVEGIPGFAAEEELALALAARRFTRPIPPGYARLALPRHATALKARYHLPQDEEDLKALLTVLIWYATEGHGNARNGGIVISSANREELERVKAAYERISDAKGYIHSGSKRDSAWRLYLGAEAIRVLAEHHCGKGAAQKRLPDFLFALPRPYLEHAWEELLKIDGSRRLSKEQQKAPRTTGGFMGSSRPFPPCWPPRWGCS